MAHPSTCSHTTMNHREDQQENVAYGHYGLFFLKVVVLNFIQLAFFLINHITTLPRCGYTSMVLSQFLNLSQSFFSFNPCHIVIIFVIHTCDVL